MRLLIPLILLCFGVSAYATHLFFKEYDIARFSLASDAQRFLALLYEPPVRAKTLRSDRELFLACDDALAGKLADIHSETALLSIAEQCRLIAFGALRSSASSSLAHYTLAKVAGVTEDQIGLNEHLSASQKTGAFESWLAKRRFNLAAENRADLDILGQAVFERDTAALIQSPKGRVFLAENFLNEPQLRELILSVAETMDESVKTSFLNVLRAVQRRAGQT